MYYARLLVSILEHSHDLLLEGDQKELLFGVLSKHAHYILRRVKNPRLNFLGLRKWDEFVKGEQFEGYSHEAATLAKEVDALNAREIKRRTIIVIRQVNKAYDDLTYDKHVSKRCLESLKKYTSELTALRFQEYCEREGPRVTQRQRRVVESLLAYNQYLGELSATYDRSRSIAVKRDYRMYGNLLEEEQPRSLSALAKEMQALN